MIRTENIKALAGRLKQHARRAGKVGADDIAYDLRLCRTYLRVFAASLIDDAADRERDPKRRTQLQHEAIELREGACHD
jgi:hypothetical protein